MLCFPLFFPEDASHERGAIAQRNVRAFITFRADEESPNRLCDASGVQGADRITAEPTPRVAAMLAIDPEHGVRAQLTSNEAVESAIIDVAVALSNGLAENVTNFDELNERGLLTTDVQKAMARHQYEWVQQRLLDMEDVDETALTLLTKSSDLRIRRGARRRLAERGS